MLRKDCKEDTEAYIQKLPALTDNMAVTSIKLLFNYIESTLQIEFFTNLITSELRDRLKKIHYLCVYYDREVFAAVAKLISESSCLEDVELRCVVDAEILINSVNLNQSIRKLHIRAGMNYDDATILAQGVSKNTSLTELDLSGNYIQRDGLVNIVRAVVAQGKINKLSFATAGGNNQISTDKLGEMVDILIPNTTLTYLDLAGIKINNEGAKLIAKLIAHNHSLCEINLSYCDINTQGYLAIKCALLKNNPIERYVDLSLNHYCGVFGDDKEVYPATSCEQKKSPHVLLSLLAKKVAPVDVENIGAGLVLTQRQL